jgi:hypothetical protein
VLRTALIQTETIMAKKSKGGNPAILAEVEIIKDLLTKSPTALPKKARESLERIEKLATTEEATAES